MFELDDDWKFIKEVENTKIDLNYSDWNRITKVDAFKQYLKNIAAPRSIKITYKTLKHQHTGQEGIQINATSNYGTLSTFIPLAYLNSPNCANSLPDTLLVGFVNSFSLMAEKQAKRSKEFAKDDIIQNMVKNDKPKVVENETKPPVERKPTTKPKPTTSKKPTTNKKTKSNK